MRRKFVPHLEQLEQRVVFATAYTLAKGVLTLQGTTGQDTALVHLTDSTLVAQVNNKTVASINLSQKPVARVDFLGRDGVDFFRNDTGKAGQLRGNGIYISSTEKVLRILGTTGRDNVGVSRKAAFNQVRFNQFQFSISASPTAGGIAPKSIEYVGRQGFDILRSDLALPVKKTNAGVFVATTTGLLQVNGTSAADRIQLTAVDRMVAVRYNNLEVARYDSLLIGLKKIELNGFDGNDLLRNDVNQPAQLNGGKGNDSLIGSRNADLLYGGAGDDTLRGNQGNDQLFGELGVDALFGNDGEDVLNGGEGSDQMTGGRQNDRYVFDQVSSVTDFDDVMELPGSDLEGRDTLDFSALEVPVDTALTYVGTIAAFGVQYVEGERPEFENLLGGEGDDRLWGTASDDYLIGGPGNDSLFGNGGTDVIDGQEGYDRILRDGREISSTVRFGVEDVPVDFKSGDKAWTFGEMVAIDDAFSELVDAVDNNSFLKVRNTDTTFTFLRYETHPGRGAYAYTDFQGNISFYDPAFREGFYFIATETTYHEIGHNWQFDGRANDGLFRAVSNWVPYLGTVFNGYILSTDGQWQYVNEAPFTSSFAKENPYEDYAMTFELYFAGGNVPPAKAKFVADLVEALRD